MKHPWILPVLLLVAACGGGLGSHEGCIEAQIDVMNDTAAVLKTVKDKKSAEAAKPKLEALSKRGKEISDAMSKLKGDPDPALQQKMMAEMTKATSNLMEAVMGIPEDPEIHQIIGNVDMGR